MDLPIGQVVLTSVVAYLLAIYYLGRAHQIGRYMTISFLAIVAYGIIVELLEIRSTHSYYYTELLVMFGERPGWVPLTIGCSWASLIFVSMRTSDLLGLKWWQRPFLDGSIAVSMDLVIDPVSSNSRWVETLGDSCVGVGEPFGGIGVWTWCVPRGDEALWFNIPLNNFFLWFGIVVTASFAVRIGANVLGARDKGRWSQAGMLVGLLAAGGVVLAGALMAYAEFLTGVGPQRIVFYGIIFGPILMMLVQARSLNFTNHLDLGLLAAPIWMFISGVGAFFYLGIDRANGPGPGRLLVVAAVGSSVLLLAPYWGTLLGRRDPTAHPPGKKPPLRVPTPDDRPTKVSILGGGVGAITTAMELTQPELKGKYDVTLYQLGWRIGGKGASGRNMKIGARIEEHGIHFWSGVYDNSFRALRSAYDELNRPPTAPMATWWDAFKPAEDPMSMMEFFEGTWKPWTITPVKNGVRPGEPDAHLLLPYWAYIGEAIQMVTGWFKDSQKAAHKHHKKQGPLARLIAIVEHWLLIVAIQVIGGFLDIVYRVVHFFMKLGHVVIPSGVRGLLESLIHFGASIVLTVVRFFVRIHWRRVRRHLDDPDVREAWCFVNLGLGLLSGIHKDEVVTRGFDTIDHLDFREWLGQHIVWDPVVAESPYDPPGGPGPRSLTLESPFTFLLYNSDFAFQDGRTDMPRLAAGVAAYTMIRLAVTAKGTLLWRMQAGMGDIVFGPYYQVLKDRGVKFEFFRKVKNLHVSEDGEKVGAVTIARQAEVAGGPTGYEPLIDVDGLPCWPSEPNWDQLADGARYKEDGVNFEDWYGPELDEFQIRAGVDYDVLVLGISLGAFPYICGELIEARSEWQDMVANIARVRTQSTQLWLTETAYDLGWKLEQKSPSVSCYDTSNFDVWFDLSHLLDHEQWPKDPAKRPHSLAYINGCMEGVVPRTTPQTPEELDQKSHNSEIVDLTVDYLENESYRIYKDAATKGSFDWQYLYDQANQSGRTRLESQYSRANVQPTELYVQSIPGSIQYRLHPADSKFTNLVLTGDWTWQSFGAGCVEGATISGMLASHGISGSPPLESILGLTFGHPNTPYDVSTKY